MELLDTLIDRDDLYLSEFPQGRFLWRLLSLKEYHKFYSLRASELFHPYYIYLKVFQKCYLGDYKMLKDMLPLGIPISIGECIMFVSGDCRGLTLKDELALARDTYAENDLDEVMKRVVLVAFPTIGPEDILAWNRKKLLQKFVEAEAMLKMKMGDQYKPLNLEPQSVQKVATPTPINFELENEAIRNSTDFWAREEPEQEITSKPKLNQQQLQKLRNGTR